MSSSTSSEVVVRRQAPRQGLPALRPAQRLAEAGHVRLVEVVLQAVLGAARHRPRRLARREHRHPGPQRLRQVHPAAGDLRHDPAEPTASCASPAASPRCWRSASTFDARAVGPRERHDRRRRARAEARRGAAQVRLDRRVRRHRRLHGPAGQALLDGHAHAARLRRSAPMSRPRSWWSTRRWRSATPPSSASASTGSTASARTARCCSSRTRWPRCGACARAPSGSRTAASARRASRARSSAPTIARCDGEGRHPSLLGERVMSRWRPCILFWIGLRLVGDRACRAVGERRAGPRRAAGRRRAASAGRFQHRGAHGRRGHDASPAYVGSAARSWRGPGAEVLICVASERDEAVGRDARADGPTRRS